MELFHKPFQKGDAIMVSARVPCPAAGGGASLPAATSEDDDGEGGGATTDAEGSTPLKLKGYHPKGDSFRRRSTEPPFKANRNRDPEWRKEEGSQDGGITGNPDGDSNWRKTIGPHKDPATSRGGVSDWKNSNLPSIFTLFVDGIPDRTDYFQIRGLFNQFGRVVNVFVQRQRKIGRLFRFGFVRFASLEVASKAIDILNGFRLGGAALSVSMARFPRHGLEVLGDQGLVMEAAGAVRREVLQFSEDEDLMLRGLDRGDLVFSDLSPMMLFPELSVCRYSISDVCHDSSGAPPSPPLEIPHEAVEVLEGPTEQPLTMVLKTPRGRGRPKKVVPAGNKLKSRSESSSRVESEVSGTAEMETRSGRELLVLPGELSEPYSVMTRARSALLMGKRLGMVYDCTDVTAHAMIAAQIMARE